MDPLLAVALPTLFSFALAYETLRRGGGEAAPAAGDERAVEAAMRLWSNRPHRRVMVNIAVTAGI